MYMLKKEIKVSDLLFDKEYRLINALKSRIRALEYQWKIGKDKCIVTDKLEDKLDVELDCIYSYIRLVNNSLKVNSEDNYKKAYKYYKELPKTIKEHSEKLLGYYYVRRNTDYDKLEELKKTKKIYLTMKWKTDKIDKMIKKEEMRVKYMENYKKMLKSSCLKARKYELQSRLMYEMQQRVNEGWYIIFNTLTVNSFNIKNVFDNGSKGFMKYVRKVDREVGRKIYGKFRDIPDNAEYHRYFGVVERGSETGRLHIHVIHMVKELPEGCYDMNRGKQIPSNREISRFKKYWEYGFSSPIAVRFNSSDAYGKLGWRVPCKMEEDGNYSIVDNGSVDKVVGYMSKYINKELEKEKGDEIPWRTRMTRGLGMKIVKKIVQSMTAKELIMIMSLKRNKRIKLKDKEIPMSLLRKEAIKIYMMTKKEKENLKENMVKIKPRKGILEVIRDIIRMKKEYSKANYTDIKTLNMRKMDGFKLVNKIKKIEKEMFGENIIKLDVLGTTIDSIV